MGQLGYLPFAMLFPEREVAHVPSGTTLDLLLEERAKSPVSREFVGAPAMPRPVSVRRS